MKNRDITNREYLSPAEAAEYLGLSRKYMYDLISFRKITSAKIGKRVIIKKSHLDDFVAEKEIGRTEIKRSTRITKAEANRICGCLPN